jgi:hypothetical protein
VAGGNRARYTSVVFEKMVLLKWRSRNLDMTVAYI